MQYFMYSVITTIIVYCQLLISLLYSRHSFSSLPWFHCILPLNITLITFCDFLNRNFLCLLSFQRLLTDFLNAGLHSFHVVVSAVVQAIIVVLVTCRVVHTAVIAVLNVGSAMQVCTEPQICDERPHWEPRPYLTQGEPLSLCCSLPLSLSQSPFSF